jgi:hypothetical protein
MWLREYEPHVLARPPRSLVRPYVPGFVSYTGSWDVTVSGIDENTGGTYYTSWVTLSGPAPRANGFFYFPSFSLEVASGIATCYLEFGSGGTVFASGITVGDLLANGNGTVIRAPGSALLVGLDYSRLMTQVRWAVVSTAPVTWSQYSTTLYKLS